MAGRSYDLVVVGGGPAGMSAALAAACHDIRIALVDENSLLGGQLPKQIHKFFGSKDHYAGVRGFEIARIMANKILDQQIDVFSDTTVWHVEDSRLFLQSNATTRTITTKALVLACGAREKPLCFPGWTLPGVVGAGALQTMVNLWRVSIGKRVLVVGSGNVGLIVAYQMVQAGLEVLAVIESRSRIGGFRVHANRVTRLGIPIHLRSKILRAHGRSRVESVEVELDGRVVRLGVDVVCIAVGMLPNLDLVRLVQGPLVYDRKQGYHVPAHDETMRLPGSSPPTFVCGDMCSVEEASIAMEEGRLAGLHAGQLFRPIDAARSREIVRNLTALRQARR